MNVDAQGNYVPFTQKYDEGLGLIMASVNIPLFHWGEGAKKVKKAKIELQNYRLDLERNTRLLSIEARQAVQNLTDGYNLVQTAKIGCRQADENLRVMKTDMTRLNVLPGPTYSMPNHNGSKHKATILRL